MEDAIPTFSEASAEVIAKVREAYALAFAIVDGDVPASVANRSDVVIANSAGMIMTMAGNISGEVHSGEDREKVMDLVILTVVGAVDSLLGGNFCCQTHLLDEVRKMASGIMAHALEVAASDPENFEGGATKH